MKLTFTVEVGDVFFNPLLYEIEVTNVHKRGTFVARVKDYNNLETPVYMSILSSTSMRNLDLRYAGRVAYKKRFLPFLPKKRVWVKQT